MSDKYFTVNIRAYLDKDEPTYIGEESLYDLLSDFSCPKNPDVEYFLLHNAIEFTKKDQSITYLVFDAEDASLVGYFSLTVKPISVRASNISKTMAKKLSRVSILDEETILYYRSLPDCPVGKELFSSKGKTNSWKYSTGICTGNHIQSQIFRRWRYGVS